MSEFKYFKPSLLWSRFKENYAERFPLYAWGLRRLLYAAEHHPYCLSQNMGICHHLMEEIKDSSAYALVARFTGSAYPIKRNIYYQWEGDNLKERIILMKEMLKVLEEE